MAERSGEGRWLSLASVITAVVVLAGGIYAFLSMPLVPPGEPIAPTPTPLHAAGSGATSTPAATAMATAEPKTGAVPTVAPPPASPRLPAREQFSTRVSLRDGEQSLMLQGRLGVGISFTAIGSTTLATLRIVQDGEERSEALIPLQRQLIAEVGGRKYSVAVVAADLGERTAGGQVGELNPGK